MFAIFGGHDCQSLSKVLSPGDSSINPETLIVNVKINLKILRKIQIIILNFLK